jgi:asparagine synthase (glutamine-hydrolysing)
MCGIAGIVTLEGPEPVAEQLAAMCQTLSHRGPDDQGIHIQENVGLGMRRLAIIDVAGGQQPIFSEDGNVRAILNGEIYNYRELRSELEARGHRFRTSSDTEVIVHLWEDMGLDFVSRLNGMFAIAVHDHRNRQFALVRDHLGIKPLYYYWDDQRLVFGSEIKALLASRLLKRQLNVDAVGQFLAWEYIPGEGTLLENVRKLKAGHCMHVDLAARRARIERYWDVPLDEIEPDPPRARGEWKAALASGIDRCVQRQLVSDVPLGAFLSGGVDSSLVVAAMGPTRAFSIGFRDPSYNELPWAQKVACHLQVQHDIEIIEPSVVDLFDSLMRYMDDPIGDFSIFPTYLVSRFARQHVTVVLTGDGGDELFGGYETYVAQQKAAQWDRLPQIVRHRVVEPAIQALGPSEKKKGLVNKAKRFVEGLEHDKKIGHARWRVFVGDMLRQQLFVPDVLRQMTTPVADHILSLSANAANRDEVDRGLYIDLKSYLVDNCLVKVDRMSMAASLEARVPLLDKELVELAFRVPSRYKVARGRTKVLLKQLAATRIPAQCVYRPKEGFSIPVKNWLRTEFRPLLEDLLDVRRIREEGIFDVPVVERLKHEHLQNRANHSHVLWSLMVFQDWRRRWAA